MKKLIVLSLYSLFCAGTIFAQSVLQSGVDGPISWEIVDEILVISGDGDMPDYDTTNPAPWYEFRNDIKKVVICEGVICIGNNAFYYNYDNLISITIPSSIKNINTDAFVGCYNVSEFINTGLEPIFVTAATFSGIYLETCTVKVPETSVSKYQNDKLGWGAFVNIVAINATITFEKEDIYMVQGIGGVEVINITLAGDVTNYYLIAWSSSNTNVATVDLTGNVTVMSPGITLITASVGSIHSSYTLTAFEQGGVDGTITWGLSDGVLYIRGAGNMPDYDPNGAPVPWNSWILDITSVDIGNDITSIGQYAFYNHQMLGSVSISGSVTDIRANAFAFCQGLSEIKIPAMVSSIDMFFLQGSSSITNILVDEANTTFSSENGVLFNKDMSILLTCPGGKSGSYTIPESVVIIGNHAFDRCTKLTSVILPSSLESIKENVFYSCNGLTSITIPASVTEIGILSFINCNNLVEFINLSPTPQTISPYVFDERMFQNCILRVPDAAVYGDAIEWGKFLNITSLESPIRLNKDEIYLLAGASEIIAVFLNEDMISPDLVSFTSSDVNIASVEHTGTVKTINPGTAVIKASYGSMYATCTLTVIELGKSTIEGTINTAGTENIRVNLYMKLPESDTKKGIIGGYVLLATTVPNDNGEYDFDHLPEGSYKIEVEIDDSELEPSKEIPVSGNETSLVINIAVDGTGAVFFDIPTGTEEFLASDLKVYPNPFADVVCITGMVLDTGYAPSLQIINTAGTVVHTQKITSPNENIYLEHLPAGMYIIRLKNGSMIKTMKIIKN